MQVFRLVSALADETKSGKKRQKAEEGFPDVVPLQQIPDEKVFPTTNQLNIKTTKNKTTMALLYKIVRDNRKNSGNLYYGRAVQLQMVDTNALAEIIQRNCTVKKSDVLAVINELIEVMTDKLQNSCTVKLDGFGTFKIGLKTVGADKAENFSITRNVKGLRVNFISTGKKDQATNKVERTFLQGATLQKYDPTKVDTNKKPGENAETPEP